MMKIFPIFIPFMGCPNKCIYCNQNLITNEYNCNYDDLSKYKTLIENFLEKNNDKKKEIAFFGGSFANLNIDIQKKYFNLVLPYQNFLSGIRISTNVNSIKQESLDFLKKNYVKTIELGVQSFSDEELELSKKNYSAQMAIKACELVQENDFSLCIQMMLGLPGSNEKTLNKTIKQIIAIKPDFVRIYPLVVLKDTPLAEDFLQKKYKPLTQEKIVKLALEICELLEKHKIKVIKIGLHPDINLEKDAVLSDNYSPMLGEIIRANIIKNKILKHKENLKKYIFISQYDLSLFKGRENKILNEIKEYNKEINIKIDVNLIKGNFYFKDSL